MVTEITKDIFPDDKKYKKVQKIVLKGLFCSNWSDMEVQKSWLFASICLIWRFTQAFWHTRGPNREFSIPRGCLGVYGKILNFEDCLEKFGCINLHVKKSFFYVLFNFDKIIFLNVTLGQIFWFNSSSAMLLEYINWRKNLNWC